MRITWDAQGRIRSVHVLAQSRDAPGKPDHAVDRLADGRMGIPDLDLPDQPSQDTDRLPFGATGEIESVLAGELRATFRKRPAEGIQAPPGGP